MALHSSHPSGGVRWARREPGSETARDETCRMPWLWWAEVLDLMERAL